MKKLFVDKRACLGCRFCEIICSLVHSGNKVKPSASRIKLQEDLADCKFEPIVCRACKNPECVKACAYDAIQLHPELNVPVIDPEKCTACTICARKCPVDAIDGGKKKIHVIDQEKCTSCGTCYEVCPARFSAVTRISGEKPPAPIPEEKRMIVKESSKNE